jgi:hypothetical protein
VNIYDWGPGSDRVSGIKENAEWGKLIAEFVK